MNEIKTRQDKTRQDRNYNQINRLGNIYGSDRGTGFAGNVWDKNYISPTLTTMSGGNREPMVLVEK